MIRSVLPRSLRTVLVSATGLTVLGTAVMGFAHTPPGRPLLNWMGMSMKDGGCPLGYDVTGSPEQKEAARRAFAASHRGTERARARPSLGFTLDATTREQVLAWATTHGVKCTTPRRGADLDCEELPASLFAGSGRQSTIRNLWFNFGTDGTLVSLIAVSRESDADLITATFASVTQGVTQQAGPPTQVKGEGTTAALSQGALMQASTEFRYQDFYVLALATNMGSGFVLTEEYRALPAVPPAATPPG